MTKINKRVKQRDNDVLLFLHVLPDLVKATVNVAQLCRVTRLHKNNVKVDVQPLALKSDGTKRTPLIGVHVGKTKRDIIQVDDRVQTPKGSIVAIDVEDGRSNTSSVLYALKKVQDAGYTAVLYGYKNFLTSHLDLTTIANK